MRHEGELVGTHDLAMQRARNKRFALRFAALGVGNRHAVDFQRSADCTLVVCLGFHEVREGTKFRALGGNEVALGLNDEVYSGCAELVPLLFGVESLLLPIASLGSQSQGSSSGTTTTETPWYNTMISAALAAAKLGKTFGGFGE